jgi:hypothetical protein
MKKNHLTFEQVAAYLPFRVKIVTIYGVNVPEKGHIYTMKSISCIYKDNNLCFEVEEKYKRKFPQKYHKFKLLLKPLSELKNNNKFWDEFYIEFGGGSKNLIQFKRSWGTEILLDPLALGYKYWTFILKHHYDVFGLIKKGLAINLLELA